MKNLLSRQFVITALLMGLIALFNVSSVFADGGYGHDPEDTAIAGISDQASVIVGIGVYTLGTVIMASAKIIQQLANQNTK